MSIASPGVAVRLLLLIAACAFFVPATPAQVTFSVFTTPPPGMSGTISFAFAGDKFVGSVQGGIYSSLYSTDLHGGNVQPFAPTIPINGSPWSNEHPVASSFGLGGFPMRDIYVGSADWVLHISHDGTKSNRLATGLGTGVTALRFDSVGTFGYDLLAATLDGKIYRINSAGVSTLIASVGELVEGLDVVPLGAKFGSLDGQIVATSELSGLLRAIDWSGKVTVLNAGHPIGYPESINFVPLNSGDSGTSIEGLYEAQYPEDVIKADGSDFAAYKGDAIVASEFYGPLWRVHWNGTAFEITKIATNPGQIEDAIFVTPNLINPPSIGCSSDEGHRFPPDPPVVPIRVHPGMFSRRD